MFYYVLIFIITCIIIHNMITSIEQREVFHVLFLRHLSGRLKPNLYALKGGVNLRLFFGSPRFSEDMDLDVSGIEVFKLRDIVMGILESKTLQVALRPYNIERIIPPDIKIAKQTETTQRFKVHLINAAGEDMFTKVEFSRRKMESQIRSESIDDKILRHYKQPPLIIPHYACEAAISQKIGALANRAETRARDIFDIYMLLPRMEKGGSKLKLPKAILEKAYQNIFGVTYEVFRDTVVGYFGKDDQLAYGHNEIWEEMQLKVGNAIDGMMKR